MTDRPPDHPTDHDPARPDPPRVGVVVITRDRKDGLLRTLDRLAALPERPPVVVVDNASTDGTADAVRDLHPGVRLLTLDRNRGAAARSVGAARLTTPYAAFSDDDSWWEPGALATAADLLDAHPRLALIAATTLVGPEQRPDPLDAVLAASPLGTAADLPGPSVLGFLACASVVRREVFLQAGGFHPVLHFGGEEQLLALDLAAEGWGVAHCPQVVAHHDPGAEPRPGRTARLRRNELLTAWLRRPWGYTARATARLARDAATDPQARRALASAVPRLPAALRHRRPLPPWVERSARLVAP
ncbi:glycosyltransferase family 2 protein [Streptomyces sp. NPDC092296]|uniref:glycosyltransferase family 2 protein n=1 Tax=Streptomyces sp. NPDC092296 TaxID=3366012 RepID=UPI0037FDDF43